MRDKRIERYRRAFPAILVLIFLAACTQEEEDDAAASFILLTEGSGAPLDNSDERIAEIQSEIAAYRESVAEQIRLWDGIARYEKLLAHEMLERGQYGPALEALSRAIEIQGDNSVLYYLAAVATARSAAAGQLVGDEEERLRRAERLYREAIRLDPNYREALYGLGVLLAFELDEPERALDPIRHLAQIETGDPAVRFLFANVLVRNGAYEEAINVYDDLSRSAPSPGQRDQAAENRDTLRSRAGGIR